MWQNSCWNGLKIYFEGFKVHMNRKFLLRTYKLSPLKYTIPKFETFWVKIGDVTVVQSYAILPSKMVFKSRGQNVKMSRDVT